MSACRFTDAIVARHLDGDVGDASEVAVVVDAVGWQPGDFLGEHLRQCAVCQRELQRCRRLDAALAEASGRATSDLEAEPAWLRNLLDRAVALATVPDHVADAPPPRRWLRLRQLASGALLLAVGFALAWWLAPWRTAPVVAAPASAPPGQPSPVGDGAGSPRPEGHPAVASPPSFAWPSAVAAVGNRIWSPSTVAAIGVPRSRADVQGLCELLGDRALADRLLLTASMQFAVCGVRGDPASATAAATALRHRASQALLDASIPLALDAWIRTTAGLDQGPVLDLVLQDARRRSSLRPQLCARLIAIGTGRHRGLADLAALTVAARLGGRDLDAALRQLLRRVDLHQELAAALRLPGPRDGRAPLLLDIWGDLIARGGQNGREASGGDDEGLARRLFSGQPPSVGHELLAELQRCRQTPRRVRCLLALGVLAPVKARDALLAILHGPVLPEALAAAFALSQLPGEALRELLPRANRGADAWLIRAALCCAGLPESGEWLRELSLTAAERTLLGSGNCTLAQFPVLASLLRDRGSAAY